MNARKINKMFLVATAALGIEMESFCYQNLSTATMRKRPTEAAAVLAVLGFGSKTWNR